MPELTHPKLPGHVTSVTDAQARVLAKSGWVPAGQETGADETTPTNAPDDSHAEGTTTDPALAGNPEGAHHAS